MEISLTIEAGTAADLKERLAKALDPVCAIMDECASLGFTPLWDNLSPQPPTNKYKPVNLRLVRTY
jgi:hypothetical protein